jgi:hypothetical protein
MSENEKGTLLCDSWNAFKTRFVLNSTVCGLKEPAWRGFVASFFSIKKRHPDQMGPPEIEAFLTHLAVDGKVSASIQNLTLSAVLFLYREVPGIQ